MNGKLTFSIHDTHLSSPLPVEIRKPNFLLVDKGLTSETKELEPGKYYVTARMPAGQELSAEVVIKTGKTVNVALAPEPAEASPHEFQAEQHFNIGEKNMSRRQITNHLNPTFDDMFFKRLDEGEDFIASHLESMFVPTSEPVVPDAALLIFKGNLFSFNPSKQIKLQGSRAIKAENSVRISVEPTAELIYAQLRQANVPPLNFALPVSHQFGCTLVVQREANRNLLSIDANLRHSQADMLLRYTQKGFLNQASLVSDAVAAEELLRDKVSDPIAAAVGAYSLLKFGEIERLHDWTENLRQFFEWLPDGAAIRGEHLARLGKHEQAAQAFLDLAQRGIPIFSDGLSYAVERMRIYVDLERKRKFSINRLPEAENLLQSLQRFSDYTDFNQPITTFTGQNPAKPDDVITKSGGGGLKIGVFF